MKDRSDDPSHHERTILPAREEICCHRCMNYCFRLAARAILKALSHRQDSIYYVFTFFFFLDQSWSTGWKEKIAQWVHHEGSIRRPIALNFIYRCTQHIMFTFIWTCSKGPLSKKGPSHFMGYSFRLAASVIL